MNRKRNVSYLKPEDPEFLKKIKKQAGYDDRNHKFDKLQKSDEDFLEDNDNEQPQVVVLKEGDLTAEQAEEERIKIENEESNFKADLSQRVLFTSKRKAEKDKHRQSQETNKQTRHKAPELLSFKENDDSE